jgi:D-cysteine desulfhydrase
MLKMKIPERYALSLLPTPVIPVRKFFNAIPDYQVWLKRDDLTGLEISGNKARKLDFLLMDAVNQNAERIVTCGGVQSNHCRSTAFYARQLGLKVTLVLRGEEPASADGNYLLDRLLGCDIVMISAEEYKTVDAFMEKLAAASPENMYIIPEGGSNEIGVWGYINCFFEIERQFQEKGIKLDAIVAATGSGGTHGGLLLGKLLKNSEVEIITVNVADNAAYFTEKIGRLIRRFCERYQASLNWSEEDIKILDGFTGRGYGIMDEREREIIRRFAEDEGIIIDPVYGAKALAGLEASLQQKKIPGKNILFIQTGGIFGVFPYRAQLQ